MKRLVFAPLRLLRTVVRHRFLVGQLALRAFSARYAGSYLGWLWTPLSTAVQFALFVVVFSVIMQVKVEGLGIDLARRPAVGFGVFLMTALVPYLALNDAVTRAAKVFREHANLVQRVKFPTEVLVVGNVSGALLHHVLALVVVVVFCAAKGHLGLAGVPWLLLGIVLWALWIFAMSLAASLIGVVLPDSSEVLMLALQLAFYGAPIIYPLSFVKHDVLRMIVEVNPLTPLAGVVRAGLTGSAPPSALALGLLALGGLLLLALAAAAMDRWRHAIPDLV